jgi:hypothetical protein
MYLPWKETQNDVHRQSFLMVQYERIGLVEYPLRLNEGCSSNEHAVRRNVSYWNHRKTYRASNVSDPSPLHAPVPIHICVFLFNRLLLPIPDSSTTTCSRFELILPLSLRYPSTRTSKFLNRLNRARDRDCEELTQGR